MTAIVDYATLKTAAAEWMFDRTDLATFMDSFIQNVEQRFNYGTGVDAPFASEPIRTRAMITSADLTVSDGVYPLPTGFIEAVRVTALSDPRRTLTYAPPDWLEEAYPTTDASDPSFYTVIGSDLIAKPATSSDIELKFYQTIPALSAGTTTNWLILAAPNVYLYGVLMEACIFLDKMARAATMFGQMNGAINGLMRTDKRSISGIPARRANGNAP